MPSGGACSPNHTPAERIATISPRVCTPELSGGGWGTSSGPTRCRSGDPLSWVDRQIGTALLSTVCADGSVVSVTVEESGLRHLTQSR